MRCGSDQINLPMGGQIPSNLGSAKVKPLEVCTSAAYHVAADVFPFIQEKNCQNRLDLDFCACVSASDQRLEELARWVGEPCLETTLPVHLCRGLKTWSRMLCVWMACDSDRDACD